MSTLPSYNKENTFILEGISKTDSNADKTSFLEWLNNQEDLKLEDPSAVTDSHSSRRRFDFRLTGSLAHYYPLLRSLSLSGITETLRLKADHSSRKFSIEFEESAERKATSYLARLLGIIQEERRFKQVLGKVLKNQAKSRQEEALLMAGLLS